jgi:hypothetical protein
VIAFDKDGNPQFVVDPVFDGLAELGTVSKRRASHVTPVNPVLRVIFRLVRWLVKDESQVAGWTRTWGCLWQADLAPSGGPVLGPYSDRKAAIRAEVDWLNEQMAG